MDLKVEFPLDDDGFLAKQCPDCMGRFKWHNGPANEEAEYAGTASAYHCPLCGAVAAPDQWFTTEQVDHLHAVMGSAAHEIIDEELEGLSQSGRRSGLRFERSGASDSPPKPTMLLNEENPGEILIASPCHAYEPIKVLPVQEVFSCLICGTRFAV